MDTIAARQLNLNEPQATLLKELLEADLNDLREEIYKTERYELRESLKEREQTINELLSQLVGLPISE